MSFLRNYVNVPDRHDYRDSAVMTCEGVSPSGTEGAYAPC